MKTIHVKEIIENVKEMCIEANHYLTASSETIRKERKITLGKTDIGST